VYQEGFAEWKQRGFPTESLSLTLKVDIPEVGGAELKRRLDAREDLVIVDLRDAEDQQSGVITGSTRIPLEDLMARFQELPKQKPIVLVDLHGKQTLVAGQYLAKQGFTRLQRLKDGITTAWAAAGYPLVR
jgi:rhodanese-related sulfurtransferase